MVTFEQRLAEGEHVSHFRYPREALGNKYEALKFHGDGEYTFIHKCSCKMYFVSCAYILIFIIVFVIVSVLQRNRTNRR